MRFAFVGLAAAFTMLALGVLSSDAQISFYSKRFCTFGSGGNGDSSGEPDCSYNKWEQCRASASGVGRYCGENPQYLVPSREAGPQESNRKPQSSTPLG